MNKEKEIEEMAWVLASRFSNKAQAIELQKAGFGDIKQAVKEFADKLKERVEYLRDSDLCSHYVLHEIDIDIVFNELYGE